jgi:hypothetical protein
MDPLLRNPIIEAMHMGNQLLEETEAYKKKHGISSYIKSSKKSKKLQLEPTELDDGLGEVGMEKDPRTDKDVWEPNDVADPHFDPKLNPDNKPFLDKMQNNLVMGYGEDLEKLGIDTRLLVASDWKDMHDRKEMSLEEANQTLISNDKVNNPGVGSGNSMNAISEQKKFRSIIDHKGSNDCRDRKRGS